MARSLWSGNISFGLVNAPVRMYPAVHEHDLELRLVHVKDSSPIGYEILDFVPYEQIDPIYFERTYYLGPERGAEKVYALLVAAMERSELAGVVRYVFHDRERLGCLRVRDGVLLLERMYFADEVRPHDEIRPKRKGKVVDQELELALTLIEQITSDFDPGQYEDRYRERLLKVIRQKRKGAKIEAPQEEKRTEAPDLLAALRESVENAQRGNGSSRGTSDITLLRPTWTSRKSSAFRDCAHEYTFSTRVSGIRSLYLPSRPGEPCATTTMKWRAGCTGVDGSALFHAATSRSSRASIWSGGISPRIPIRFERGFP